jgi:hypothetical protein
VSENTSKDDTAKGGRPRSSHHLPLDEVASMTWEQYFSAHFAIDEDGRIYCILCGCYIRDGWQVDHVDRAHGLRFGLW